MTPAEQALQNTITFEAKKDSLRQSQSGDWKIAFTVQGIDMDTRLSKAAPGTRYVAVLVEINDQELPVPQRPAKETRSEAHLAPAKLLPDTAPAGAKRDWRDMKPSAQAAIRCGEAIFWAFMNEEHGYNIETKDEAAEAVRDKCGVISRKLLDVENFHAARVIWHQLDTSYAAWKALEHA